ncbi:MAG: MmcQ/YjbR family DNA-binding protein [Bacteroidia bacterium]
MNIETIRSICNKLPHVTEDIKWGNDLCFLIGGKMFCVVGLNEELKVSIKVMDEEFEVLTNLDGIIPAPYVAKHKWVLVEKPNIFNQKKWQLYISQSYSLVKAKLPKKVQAQLN